jgi:creatinine amidohydrolase/Fe(II)-dependent formamide hydrolase-like protein
VTPLGYFGDPTTASPEEGKRSKEDFGKAVSEVIEKFLSGQYQPPEMK